MNEFGGRATFSIGTTSVPMLCFLTVGLEPMGRTMILPASKSGTISTLECITVLTRISIDCTDGHRFTHPSVFAQPSKPRHASSLMILFASTAGTATPLFSCSITSLKASSHNPVCALNGSPAAILDQFDILLLVLQKHKVWIRNFYCRKFED